MIARIAVDTNNIIRDGLIWAYTGGAKRSGFVPAEELSIGDSVFAHDVAEQGDFKAVIRDIANDRVFLEIDWDSFTPWEVPAADGYEEGDYYEEDYVDDKEDEE